MTILDKIVATTRETVAKSKRTITLQELQSKPLYTAQRRDFLGSLRESCRQDVPALIAEVKKASPSKGLIREGFEPVAIATSYRDAGASCISVLTDEPYFQGSLQFLVDIRTTVEDCLPLLRKDFVIDVYQLHEAKAFGADAVLLIMAILDDSEFKDLFQKTQDLGLQALVEAYTIEEAERALKEDIRILGINNRNLKDFSVDLKQTERAFKLLQDQKLDDQVLLVSESGIGSYQDASHLRSIGAEAMLVGESLMRQKDISKAVKRLLGTDVS